MGADTIAAYSQVLIAFGLLLAIWQVKVNHDKSRREYAARLIWDWTTNVRKNTRATTKLIDNLDKTECDAIFQQNAFQLNVKHEQLLRAALSGSSLEFTKNDNIIEIDEAVSSYVRSMVTHYLNLLESVLVAWYHKVGDQHIIEEQFR